MTVLRFYCVVQFIGSEIHKLISKQSAIPQVTINIIQRRRHALFGRDVRSTCSPGRQALARKRDISMGRRVRLEDGLETSPMSTM